MKLNKKQKEIVETEKRKVHVVAGAASGKTALIVERIRFLLDKGEDAAKIVAITFTNNAALEMYERLGRPSGLFIGTVHSYCNFLLKSNGIDTDAYIEKEDFDELFELIKENQECINPIDHLIVDEFQDSSPAQINFFRLLNPKNYMYCYDHRQAIYSFGESDIDYILRMQSEPGVTIYEMNENYRNGYNILQFAKNLLHNLGADYQDNSIAMRPEDGFVMHTKWSYNNIADYLLEEEYPYKDWFVLARSNAEIDVLCDLFSKKNIPYTTFKQGSSTLKEIEEELNSNKVKVLTIHSAKGLESPNVLVVNAGPYYNDEERRVFYVAATRAKNLLIWNKIRIEKKKKDKSKVKMMSWE